MMHKTIPSVVISHEPTIAEVNYLTAHQSQLDGMIGVSFLCMMTFYLLVVDDVQILLTKI